MSAGTGSERLRSALATGDAVVAAGCFDPLSAWIAHQCGFRAVHLSGFAADAAYLAAPDVGLMTMTERLDVARRIVGAVEAPLICDGEDGWGDAVAVTRLVEEAMRSGVAALHIEDQAAPKRCPALGGRSVLDRAGAVSKVRAAVSAADGSLVVIARSDADCESVQEVVDRCNAYLAAGADLALPMLAEVDGTPISDLAPAEQLAVHQRVVDAIDGPTAVAAIPAASSLADLVGLGFRMVLLPLVGLRASMNALHGVYADAIVSGAASTWFADNPGPWPDSRAILDALGAQAHLDLEARFSERN